MILKILNIPFIIITHYRALGYHGILLLFKRYFINLNNFKILLPKYPFPIFLRNNTSDINVFYQVFLAKSYNINFRINPKIIIDCGANIGLSTIYFKNKFPNAKIIAIEPEKSNFLLLEKNTKEYNDVFCVKYGVWNKSTNLIINNKYGKWGFMVEEVEHQSENTIPAISIDEIMEKFDINEIDILKIDIEGSEKNLFESNFECWLSKTKVLIIELHDFMRAGSSMSFIKAISNYEFNMARKNENLIFYLNKEIKK